MTLDEVITEHAPALYTSDDSAAVLDEAIHSLGTRVAYNTSATPAPSSISWPASPPT